MERRTAEMWEADSTKGGNEMTEPQLVDSENIMMISTIEQAKTFYGKLGTDNMVLITHWMPMQGNEEGITFEPKKKKSKSSFSRDLRLLRPISKDTVFTWAYSEDKIQTALKIFSLMGWQHPEIYCQKEVYPLMIRSGKRYDNTNKESVILIAPRILSE